MNNPQKFYGSTLFPDPSSIPNQSSNYRSSRKRKYRDDDRDEELTAFGYESKIYNDQSLALRIENGSYLIPWKSHADTKVLMDRYDVRHLVEDQTLFQVDQKAVLDEEYDKERYVDLKGDNDEALDSSKSRSKAAIPFNYDDDSKIEEEEEEIRVMTAIEKEIMIKYKTPNSMHVPKSKEQLSIIEATAKEIGSATTNSNLLEIRIQVTHASNPLYSFLNKQDQLYPFYKHLLSISSSSKASATMKKVAASLNSSLVAYSDSESDDEDERTIEEPPAELKQVILKTTEFIAKSNNSNELEQHIKLKRGHDPKFSFLHAGDVYHGYFQSQIKERLKK